VSALTSKPMLDGFKWGLVASVSVLLTSLVLFVGDIVAGFVYFSREATPLWVTVLGAVAALGIAVGFAGFFLLMAIAGWRSYRESKRVQVISPRHEGNTHD
jgi:hypothetical protein